MMHLIYYNLNVKDFYIIFYLFGYTVVPAWFIEYSIIFLLTYAAIFVQ